MESPIIMKGNKVNLCLPLESDIEFLLKVINDPVVTKYLRFPNNLHFQKDEIEWLQNLSKSQDKNKVFIIRESATNDAVGVIGLHNVDWYNRHAELGYLLKRESWGKGLATEASRLIIEYGFEILNLRKIYAFVKDGNEGSVRVLLKNNFNEIGRFKKHDYAPYEGYRDLLIFELFNPKDIKIQ